MRECSEILAQASVTAIPYVHYINLARSKNHLVRNKETVQHNIAQNDPVDLQSGDSLQLSSGNDKEPGVTLVFEWHSIYPLFLRLPKPRMTALSNRAAPLGIKIAKRPSSDITHLVVDQLDPSIAELYTSLMADAKVVNQDWWSDVCQRAEAPRGQEHSWEDLFAELEDLDRWAPALKDGLSPVQLKVDTRRKKIFDGLTFVLLSDASPASELTAQLELGGAKVESVDLLEAEITSISLIPRFMAMKKAASTRLAKSIRLEKGALIESLYVVIAKESVQSALGRTWAKYEEMISSLDLSILSVEQIHLSILNVSTDFIRHAASSRPLLDGSSQAGEELRTAPLMPGTASLSGKVVASSLPDEVPATLLEPGVSDDVQAPPTATQFKVCRNVLAVIHSDHANSAAVGEP
ncbi:hypothetical protein CALVIDRAFT_338618 [Calocera viscosa TUFC12733]|uniref:BRCT domain-containing protein n=1 Tax=Calocera viscosa (strain TUFC12733) TaxID=1330018 RepID=A0A167HGW0_CALVF|nr:hypothetical protein CALVIDRAFT_338618 [Calocera viscosa TUFC12733]